MFLYHDAEAVMRSALLGFFILILLLRALPAEYGSM